MAEISVPHPQSADAVDAGPLLDTTDLARGAIGLVPAIMQSVALIAPAVASMFFVPFIVGFAGLNSPLAYPVAFLITLALGYMLVQLSKQMPSAGGYFTYNSRAVHPRAGFM